MKQKILNITEVKNKPTTGKPAKKHYKKRLNNEVIREERGKKAEIR